MRPPRLIVILLLLGAATTCRAQSFSEKIAWSEGQADEARAELAKTRASILEAKRPKIEALTTLQASVMRLRRLRESLSSQTAGLERENERREAELRSFEQALAFTTGRLRETRASFEESLHLAERPAFAERLIATERVDEGDVDPEITRLRAHFDLVDAAIGRLGNALGGNSFAASVVVDDIVENGTVLQLGPYAYFSSESGHAGVLLQKDTLQPVLRDIGRDAAENIERALTGAPGKLPFDPSLDGAFVIADSRLNITEHIRSGGLWMIPIFFFGFLGAVIAILKFLHVRTVKVPTTSLVDDLIDIARTDGTSEQFQTSLRGVSPGLRPIFTEGFTYRKAAEDTREAAMHQQFITFRTSLEARLSLISVTAAVSPLLGLLGTVTGMIKTFHLIGLYGTGDARALSSGISEALVTTEYGLIVAIPALLLHALLSRRTKRIVIQTAALIDRFNKTVSFSG